MAGKDKPYGKKGGGNTQKSNSAKLFPVEELAEKAGMPDWELAGLRQCFDWLEGKQVSEADFNKGLALFRNRPQGGGKLFL